VTWFSVIGAKKPPRTSTTPAEAVIFWIRELHVLNRKV